MGHSFSVDYSNIFMADWEKEALTKCIYLPLFFVRFIDDMFMIWTHGKELFDSFFQILNTHLPGIKLTYVYDTESIDFLDVTVYKGKRFRECGYLDTKVYFKPTDTHQLLHAKSFHPKHVFSSVIKSQVIRYNRICNNTHDFDSACSTLFSEIRKRGYSIRKLRRIKSEVASNRLDYKPTPTGSCLPCNSPRCQKCKFILRCSNVIIHDHNYNLKHNFDCNSKNIVYVIRCLKCNVNYIGQTGNMLRRRLQDHLGDIRHSRNTSVANHFNSKHHNIPNDLRIAAIESVPQPRFRLLREAKLIDYFDTMAPKGLNNRNDVIKNSMIVMKLPYSHTSNLFAKNVKEIVNESRITDKRIITAFKRQKNLSQELCKL